jgi:folate-binding protein YgfZ
VTEVLDGLAAWGEALEAAPGARVLGSIQLVCVTGSEAIGFLQGQLSQDVGSLAIGASCWSLLLEPDGSLGHLVRVVVAGPEQVLVLGALGRAEAIAGRLRRFLLRVDAAVDVSSRLLVAGRSLPAGTLVLPKSTALLAEGLVERTDAPDDGAAGLLEAWALVRGELASADVAEGTNPFELGAEWVGRTASFTKGCYTGQELVARVQARAGSAPQRLCHLVASGMLESGAVIVDDQEVGTVERAVCDPSEDRTWATARIARKVALDGPTPCAVDGLDGVLTTL